MVSDARVGLIGSQIDELPRSLRPLLNRVDCSKELSPLDGFVIHQNRAPAIGIDSLQETNKYLLRAILPAIGRQTGIAPTGLAVFADVGYGLRAGFRARCLGRCSSQRGAEHHRHHHVARIGLGWDKSAHPDSPFRKSVSSIIRMETAHILASIANFLRFTRSPGLITLEVTVYQPIVVFSSAKDDGLYNPSPRNFHAPPFSRPLLGICRSNWSRPGTQATRWPSQGRDIQFYV